DEVRLPAGQTIFNVGDPGGAVYIVLSGEVELFFVDATGDRVLLEVAHPGDVFGEISLLLDGPCTATVRTASFCEVLELSRDDFKSLVLPNPEVKAIVRKMAGERLQRTADLLDRESSILPDYIV
ncbi:MAG TPA: cyclic nucleotide-binding domain-containing protein, partial [Myxococcales bacterium]